MLRSEKVATPFTAVTIVVPESVPPLGFVPRATVIEPVKPATVFPASSCAATWTGGEMALPAVALLGWTAKTRWVAGGGTSESTVASQVRGAAGESNNQVHCGSTAPAAVGRATSPSLFMNVWDCVERREKPPGPESPAVASFDIVTPYASAPAPIAIAPGSAIVVDVPKPDADW